MNSEKYSRQILFSPIGAEGQEKLLQSKVVILGCGALGTAQANALVRAGVGTVRIVDRDFVEESNLQRQMLFDEADARESLPKAVAAERKLRQINSDVNVEGIVADADSSNIEEFIEGFDVVLDATDNFETRYLLNDAAVKTGDSLDLWRRGGQLRGHDDDSPRAHGVPGLRIPQVSARDARDLRYGGRHWPRRLLGRRHSVHRSAQDSAGPRIRIARVAAGVRPLEQPLPASEGCRAIPSAAVCVAHEYAYLEQGGRHAHQHVRPEFRADSSNRVAGARSHRFEDAPRAVWPRAGQ